MGKLELGEITKFQPWKSSTSDNFGLNITVGEHYYSFMYAANTNSISVVKDGVTLKSV